MRSFGEVAARAREVAVLPLTRQQRRVFDFIREHWRVIGIAPSYAEIASAMLFRSDNAAHEHVNTLRRKGWVRIVRKGGRPVARGIVPLVDPPPLPRSDQAA